jgi:4-amino-4-deoxy-L-arabinose transferase-like glycosyltransferase
VPRALAGWLVLALLCVLAFAWQGTRGLWDPDEGRYTAVALQMLDSGEWLVPRLSDHQEHLTKPPLYYWTVAASVAAFGMSEWAVRLPNALAFVLTGLLVLALARSLAPRRPWLAPLAWATSLYTVLAANVASTDTLLALFETAAMYCAWRAQRDGDSRAWHTLMWTAFGLAFLTKGPPGCCPCSPLSRGVR